MDPDVSDLRDVPENFQRSILMFLVWNGEDGDWWTVEELMQRVGDPIVALDALATLADAGLIHREDCHVFPTRAARHYHHLFG
jgi:hypothetical protein